VQLQLLVDAQAAHLQRIADVERDMGSSARLQVQDPVRRRRARSTVTQALGSAWLASAKGAT
jgi:hypothetical protein